MADITKFFEALSERAYKENNLSDVTYAMCEADLKFRKFFLDFFFKDAHLDASKVTIEREHSETNGRPDFWIKTAEGTPYIVEVKIWDRNHHFDDYFKILRESAIDNATDSEVWRRLGYIANYESVKDVEVLIDDKRGKAKDLCRVATWKKFHEALQEANYFEHPVISAYASYLKRVCPFDAFEIDDSWNIEVKHFTAVKQFIENVHDVIEALSAGSELRGIKLYNTVRRFRSQQWMGMYFEWTIAEGELSGKAVRGWLGVYYRRNGAVVCVEFENRPGWGDWVCKRYESGIQDGLLKFYANDSETVRAAKESLKSFFVNVLKAVQDGNALLKHDIFSSKQSIEEDRLSKPLLAMKCLPFALENHFITDEFEQGMVNAGYEFCFVSESDEEIPSSHCGRHFVLRKRDTTGSGDHKAAPVCRGWIGMLYSDDCRYMPDSQHSEEGKSFADEPSFVVEVEDNFLTDKAKADWAKNTWGWRFRKIKDGRWEEVLKNARDILLTVCKQSLS